MKSLIVLSRIRSTLGGFSMFIAFLTIGCLGPYSASNDDDPRLCKNYDFNLLEPVPAGSIDQESILRSSLSAYKQLKAYDADISVKYITLVSRISPLLSSFRAEQRTQVTRLKYSKSDGVTLEWDVFQPQVIDCVDSRMARETCESEVVKASGKEWCQFLRQDMFDSSRSQLKGEGVMRITHEGSAVQNYRSGQPEYDFETFSKGLDWLDNFSGTKGEIVRLLADEPSALLSAIPAASADLLGEDKVDGRVCYVLRVFKESSGTIIRAGNDTPKDPNGLWFSIWVRKDDWMIPRVEVSSRMDGSQVLWIENHRNISFR